MSFRQRKYSSVLKKASSNSSNGSTPKKRRDDLPDVDVPETVSSEDTTTKQVVSEERDQVCSLHVHVHDCKMDYSVCSYWNDEDFIQRIKNVSSIFRSISLCTCTMYDGIVVAQGYVTIFECVFA